MRRSYFLAGLSLIVAVSCTVVKRREAKNHSDRVIHSVAFGSCINTNEHPMLDQFLRQPWDLAVMLGDNIYADTTNVAVMRAKYHERKGSDFWRKLRERGPLLATWDDHDFGTNDGGANYPLKREAQRLFLEFMDEPQDSERWRREGVYDARIFGPPGKRVQFVMLDTRYFRSTLSTGIHNAVPSGGPYVPTQYTNTTILGEAQWKWLETTLDQPAEVRVIGSSIQFLSAFSGAEAWANMPHEKTRMLDLLEKVERGELSSMKSRVVFMSGDRHWAELSRLERPGLSPLYELTSSALTQKHPRGTPTPNKLRFGPTYHNANMGLLMIDWDAHDAQERPKLRFKLLDQDGTERISEGWF